MAGTCDRPQIPRLSRARRVEGVRLCDAVFHGLSVYDQLIKSGRVDARLDRRQLSEDSARTDYFEVAWRALRRVIEGCRTRQPGEKAG